MKVGSHSSLKDVHARLFYIVHVAVPFWQARSVPMENHGVESGEQSHLDGSLDEVEEGVNYPETCFFFLCYSDDNCSVGSLQGSSSKCCRAQPSGL